MHEAEETMVLKITLNDSKPRIWRRIEVPVGYTFFELHCAIQDAMGWQEAHLHAFRVDIRSTNGATRRPRLDDRISIQLPNPEIDAWVNEEGYRDERKERIDDWFGPRMQECLYDYDFGDGWEHAVLLEKRGTIEIGETYPRCLAGKNACPPEDCGGVYGYRHLLEVLRDPAHAEHEDMLDWLDIGDASEFDSAMFDPTTILFRNLLPWLAEYEKHLEY